MSMELVGGDNITKVIYRVCDLYHLAGKEGVNAHELLLCAIAQGYLPLPQKYEPHFKLPAIDINRMITESGQKFGWGLV